MAEHNDPQDGGARRGHVGADESVGANRHWWDAEADEYYAEHGGFLGDAELVWGPEGWTERELGLLGDVSGRRVLEIGAGAAQGGRYLRSVGAEVVSTDLSFGMLRQGRRIDAARPARTRVPLIQADGRVLPFADGTFDAVLTAYGVLPFVADGGVVMAEAARVLRPGGRFVFSLTHPIRWAFPDDPGEFGLRATLSYFDTTPYHEYDGRGRVTYVEHHATIGERVRQLAAAGFVVRDIVEPEWPEDNTETWGGWSPMRGAVLPGTAIFVADKA